jgi:predicted ArsR family transcriptional regulator
MNEPMKDKLAQLASLAEPVRRDLYEFAIRQDHEVSRDEASKAVKISRALAAFHLDRLVSDGLLDVIYRRAPGRSGPGAGRPSKLYKRSAEPVEFTAPPRNYALLAGLFAASAGSKRRREAADEEARRKGLEIGKDARMRAGKAPSDRVLVGRLADVLRENGFEPVRKGGEVRLRNCPFDALANDYRDLVCGMNLAMQRGILEGLRTRRIVATFEPTPGACCVAFRIGDSPNRRAQSSTTS